MFYSNILYYKIILFFLYKIYNKQKNKYLIFFRILYNLIIFHFYPIKIHHKIKNKYIIIFYSHINKQLMVIIKIKNIIKKNN